MMTVALAPPATGRLAAEELYRPCDPTRFDFRTTAELQDAALLLGQQRAVAALQFGLGIRRDGYNLFVLGPGGAGRHIIAQTLLQQRATAEPAACDWCYVHNFEAPQRPAAISLPPGGGAQFRRDMTRLVRDLQTAITAALESDQYRRRRHALDQELDTRHEQALDELRDRAAQASVALVRTPMGVGLTPARDGKVLDDEAIAQLSEEERGRFKAAIARFEKELEDIFHQTPKWRREGRERVRELKREVTSAAVEALVADMKKRYEAYPAIGAYLAAVQQDAIENADDFRRQRDGEEGGTVDELLVRAGTMRSPLGRYQVNVVCDRTASVGAPVWYEDNPTFQNLIGRVEHVAQIGTLVTDFTLIKPGALHRANGGYLVLDAHRVLVEPFAWEALKRALRAREIRIESLGQALSLVSTVSLEPEPIPLTTKVVLIGDARLYDLLHRYDPDFKQLFKVAAEFETTIDRTEENEVQFARLAATLARREGLRPLTAAGVGRVLEQSARLSGEAGKLALGLSDLTDLLRQGDYWAGVAARDVIDSMDVQRAIDGQIERAGRPRDRLQEEIIRGTLMVATSGAQIGQINALSVMELGGFVFARPSRITARVRLGKGTVVDIEREVELGGPIHSKGVLILSGFLAGRYVPDLPLSLAASIVFEQSYAFVEGDSASSAELYALLSALADVPVTQAIAATGSVNQRGEIQAVGAVNEKIEGFFDVCRAQGLTGGQGVLIPATNRRDLMLRRDVVQAVADGQFHVYAIDTIDQGLEILTGLPAGARDKTGRFPPASVNDRVERRLMEFAQRTRAFRSNGGATVSAE
jgi:predicted ATP-dependent protease